MKTSSIHASHEPVAIVCHREARGRRRFAGWTAMITVLSLMLAGAAEAQYGDAWCPPDAAGGGAQFAGGIAGAPNAGQAQFQQVRGDLQRGNPGRLWFEANYVDRGLGYDGSYLTLGGKRRLCEDFLDGRWLLEGRFHHGLEEDGGFFSNIGIERVISIPSAGADVSVSGWYDYDADQEVDFSNPFHQVGISTSIKTERWDLLGNGYFPIGNSEYTLGDPTMEISFARNRIVRSVGIDAALRGFDTALRMRPRQLAFANGTIDLGGYAYESDLIDFFGGGRARVGFQALRGAIVSAEVNHDDRFKTTGLVSLTFLFGANGGIGGEYSAIGRDLEETVRNDHIVRGFNDAAFVINPRTGLPYDVVHVNNTADPSTANGSFENPFTTTMDGQNNSSENDVIWVDEGNGTDTGYDTGIVLKDGQQLRGDGVAQLILDASGELIPLVKAPTGIGPILSNAGGTEVVRLANNNVVAGIQVDATAAGFGISGQSVSGGTIDVTTVRNATGSGVDLQDISGDWMITDNTFESNGAKGLKIENVADTTSDILIARNMANSNGTDGIRLENLDPASILIDENTTSSNAGNGLVVDNFINTNLIPLTINNHTSDANAGAGILINGGRGPLNIFTPTVTNNFGTGLEIRNWVNTDPTQLTTITGLDGNIANFTGNGLGSGNIDIILDQPGLTQNVRISNTLLDSSGGVGLKALAEGIGTVLNIDVIENVTITNNVGDGIQFLADNSGVINTTIGNPDLTAGQLLITNNALTGGQGIALFADGIGGQPASEINAVIQNVSILNDTSEIFATVGNPIFRETTGVTVQSLNNAVVRASVLDSDIGSPPNSAGLHTTNGVVGQFDNDGNGLVNQLTLARLNIFAGNQSGTGHTGIGVFLNTEDDTLTDVLITDSIIRPNGVQGPAISNATADNTVFTDTTGDEGIVIRANGAANVAGGFYFAGPGTSGIAQSEGGPFFDVTSDGINDNFTRVTILNTTVRDFTFDGIDVATTGDANLDLQLTGNTIYNNGAGLQNDTDNDGIYNEEPDDNSGTAPPFIDQLLFFDGVNIDAREDSTISARITNNLFQDNFERGLNLNTFQRATLNALVANNGFVGNDRGDDVDLLPLPTVNGQNRVGVVPGVVSTFDIEAINNEEYYFRPWESPVYVQTGDVDGGPGDGDLIDPNNPGVDPADGSPGFFIPGNVGTDFFGNPVPFGTALMNVCFVDNGVQNGVDIRDFSVPPGELNLAAEGTNAGFTGFGTSPTTCDIVDAVITNEELLFIAAGFSAAPTH